MEIMNVQWDSIVFMPYKFFIDTLKWKIDLEDEKRKALEEKTGGASSRGLVKA